MDLWEGDGEAGGRNDRDAEHGEVQIVRVCASDLNEGPHLAILFLLIAEVI